MTVGRPLNQVQAVLLENRPVGQYRLLRWEAPGVPDRAAPGHFVALTVGGLETSMLLRRSFSLHDADAQAQTVDLVVAAHGPGTQWLTSARPGAVVDMVGPCGAPFPMPEAPTGAVLVGGGYGAAPLYWLARRLRAQGSRVALVLGAAEESRLFGVEAASSAADRVFVTTVDGSAGEAGLVSDALPAAVAEVSASVVYSCGPMGMLRAVTDVAHRLEVTSWVAVEEAMACGIGICMTCVMPVRDDQGTTKMMRSCVDGPIFRGDRLRWESFVDGRCVVPDDAVGAAGQKGH